MKIVGDVDIIAFRARVQHGNHNNPLLIDRQIPIAMEKLWEMQARLIKTVKEIEV